MLLISLIIFSRNQGDQVTSPCMSPCSSDYIFTDDSVGVWRVVSEDSSSYLFNRSLSLFAHHMHLVGLLYDLDQSMSIEMAFDIHCHHDFAKQMIVTIFERER